MLLKRLIKFLKRYKLLGLAITALIAGLILQLSGQATATKWLLDTVSVIVLMPLLWNMWQDIRAGTYGIDILAATAIAASVLLDQYWAAIIIVLMLTGGEALEDFAERRAKSELTNLLKHAPRKAHVIRKSKTFSVPVSELHIGDRIIIKPGEVVPVDAIVIDGGANFDESSLTGESVPRLKSVGDALLSGSINLDGAVSAKVVASAEDSQYQQIVKLVRGAAASRAPFVRLAERYSLPFTFSAYAIAATVWLISGDPMRFLEVIVVATPCPLLLAAPVAFISGMSRASRYGIIAKTGSALERLADAKTIAFDKTGTLTHGKLQIDKITVLGSQDITEVAILAASLEQYSDHVLAKSVVSYAQEKKLRLLKMKHVKELAGRGVIAEYKGKSVMVGRLELLQTYGVKLPPAKHYEAIDQTAAYVAYDSELIGIITLSDEPRAESKPTLQLLKRLGLKNTLMITGDSEATAKAIANKLDIEEVHAQMLPADKLGVLDLVKERPLVFVGDGVNDAPALSSADVGIAMGARGSMAASESADLVILTDDLGRVATAYAVAKRTISIAKQSILIGIGISLALMLVFATGKFSAITGAIVQEVVDVIVIFNALRAHTGKLGAD